MRHETENVLLPVGHPRDVARRAIGVLALGVAEEDLPLGLELVERGLGRVVAAGGVLDGHGQRVALLARAREGSVGVLDDEVDLAADEAQARVGQQRAWQQPRLAQNLEAVAYAEHGAAAESELAHRLHHRREASDRARAQVVAVGEAARDDDGVGPTEVAVGMPEQLALAEALAGEQRVDLITGAGEADDPELHRSTTRIS